MDSGRGCGDNALTMSDPAHARHAMHSMTIDGITFHYNGDFSGSVEIVRTSTDKIEIPGDTLRHFLAEAVVRREKERELEQTPWWKLLGMQEPI